MSLKARILISFMLVFGITFYFITDSIIKEMRPRYLEAVEESLNDTANTLAALMETQVKNGALDVSLLESFMKRALEREFSAKIFGYRKTRVGLNVYVTDNRGVVIYDSRGDESPGKDYSHWNDVYLTLRGKYGARSTRVDPNDPASNLLYVAAPVMHDGKLLGIITVIKPQDSVTPFIDIARKKLITGGIITAAALLLMSIILSFWIGRPLTSLRRYVGRLRTDESARLPRIGAGEIRDLGREFESIWEELKGKKYIEDYVQSLAHELKSPLTSIRGSSELLEEDMPEEQKRAFYRTIIRESRRMEAVIQRMLELSALENRSELKDVEQVAIDDLFSEVLDALAPQIDRKKLKVEKVIDQKISVMGEKFLLGHAVSNLLENAIRFSDRDGTITLSARKETDRIIMSVANRGQNIPGYALEKIFDRFYSLPDPDTGKKSTGLGLSFVREAASLHGGTVMVRNVPGGVVAEISLPA